MSDDEFSLASLFPSRSPPPEDDLIHYGPLALSLPSTQGKAITLLADKVFNPALVLAEQIELGGINVVGKSVCELGAGTGLPGLFAFSAGAEKVVLTDYPDENILQCLWGNLRRNVDTGNVLSSDKSETDSRWCTVEGYEWGKDTDSLIRLVDGGFDILFLADLLWYTTQHEALVNSIAQLLGRSGQAWIGSGEYTTMNACESFMRLAEEKGLVATRIELRDDWQGAEVCSLKNLRERKKTVWLWKMEWAQSLPP